MTSPIWRKRSFGARLTGKAHVSAKAGPAMRRRQPGLCAMLRKQGAGVNKGLPVRCGGREPAPDLCGARMGISKSVLRRGFPSHPDTYPHTHAHTNTQTHTHKHTHTHTHPVHPLRRPPPPHTLPHPTQYDGLPLCNACGLYHAKNESHRPKQLWKEDGTLCGVAPVGVGGGAATAAALGGTEPGAGAADTPGVSRASATAGVGGGGGFGVLSGAAAAAAMAQFAAMDPQAVAAVHAAMRG
eukprot:352397-Chlamydomonas_euryale.AAC.1